MGRASSRRRRRHRTHRIDASSIALASLRANKPTLKTFLIHNKLFESTECLHYFPCTCSQLCHLQANVAEVHTQHAAHNNTTVAIHRTVDFQLAAPPLTNKTKLPPAVRPRTEPMNRAAVYNEASVCHFFFFFSSLPPCARAVLRFSRTPVCRLGEKRFAALNSIRCRLAVFRGVRECVVAPSSSVTLRFEHTTTRKANIFLCLYV